MILLMALRCTSVELLAWRMVPQILPQPDPKKLGSIESSIYVTTHAFTIQPPPITICRPP